MEKIISVLKERKLFSFVLILYIVFLAISISVPYMNVTIKMQQQDGYYGSESGYKPTQWFSIYSFSNPEKIKRNINLINSELIGKWSCSKFSWIVWYDMGSNDTTWCDQERINTILKYWKLILLCINLWAIFMLLWAFFFGDWIKERGTAQNIKIVGCILLWFWFNAIIGQIFPNNSETVWFSMILLVPLLIMNIVGFITILSVLHTEIRKHFPKKKAQ